MLSATGVVVTTFGMFWSQLFVIAHGGEVDEMPAWVVDLGVAMCNAHGIKIDHGIAKKSGVDLDGNLDPEGSPHLLFIDWSKKSKSFGIADEQYVAGILAASTMKRVSDLRKTMPGPQRIRFAGFSRGGFMVCAAIKIMGSFLQNEIAMLDLLDAYPKGSDGIIEANPGGFIDVTRNFFRGVKILPHGDAIPGALNVDLANIMKLWPGRRNNEIGHDHSEVHDWYHWTWDQKVDYGQIIPYEDPALKKQQEVFVKEHRGPFPIIKKTRGLLYGGMPGSQIYKAVGPTIENFGGVVETQGLLRNIAIWSRQGANVKEAKDWSFMQVMEQGHLDLLQPSATYRTANILTKDVFEGDITAEFTFQMIPCVKEKSRMEPVDGIAFFILPGKKWGTVAGRVGGEFGVGGLADSFAITFDARQHVNHNDPEDHDKKVSLRAKGDPTWINFSDTMLKRSFAEGDPWHVRISFAPAKFNPKKVLLTVRLYSEQSDETTIFQNEIPREVVPHIKNVGVSTASEGGGMWVRITNFIVTPTVSVK